MGRNGEPKPAVRLIGAFTALLFLALGTDLLLRGRHRFPAHPEWVMAGADASRGRVSIIEYGCGACHVIPGIRGASGRVGPRLDGLHEQIYVGGVLPNSPRNLARWIENPQEFSPNTAMPDLGVTDSEARDIAAYLFGAR